MRTRNGRKQRARFCVVRKSGAWTWRRGLGASKNRKVKRDALGSNLVFRFSTSDPTFEARVIRHGYNNLQEGE